MMSLTKPLLFIVDDEPSTLAALERLLRNDFEVQTFTEAEKALAQLEQQDPALVLTDSIMPKMTGHEFLKRVRLLRPNSLRVLLSGQIANDDLSEAINIGLIHRFFVKPWDNEILKLQLLECLQQRKTLIEKDFLATLALTDPVTGLGNHRLFQEQLRIEIARAQRHQRPLSLMMMDIDHFKTWNDQFGHPAGDLLLKNVSSLLLKGLRNIDWVARYGGDEFAMILPDTQSHHALQIAERLRTQFFKSQEAHQGPGPLSLSFGIASFPEHAAKAKELIQAADQALYQAKHQGRNQSLIAATAQ
ncbi:MAG: diguanylate cyclase [Pseudobdellovibrionaceae bacterium]